MPPNSTEHLFLPDYVYAFNGQVFNAFIPISIEFITLLCIGISDTLPVILIAIS
jgi:hypothetical protein